MGDMEQLARLMRMQAADEEFLGNQLLSDHARWHVEEAVKRRASEISNWHKWHARF